MPFLVSSSHHTLCHGCMTLYSVIPLCPMLIKRCPHCELVPYPTHFNLHIFESLRSIYIKACPSCQNGHFSLSSVDICLSVSAVRR